MWGARENITVLGPYVDTDSDTVFLGRTHTTHERRTAHAQPQAHEFTTSQLSHTPVITHITRPQLNLKLKQRS